MQFFTRNHNNNHHNYRNPHPLSSKLTFLISTGTVPGSSFGWDTGNSWLVSHPFLRPYRQILGQYLELYYICFLSHHSYFFTHGHTIHSFTGRAADTCLNQACTVSHTYIQDNLELSFNLPLLLLILFFTSFLHFVPQLNYISTSDIPVASDVRQDRSRSDTDRPNTATFTKQNSPNIFEEQPKTRSTARAY